MEKTYQLRLTVFTNKYTILLFQLFCYLNYSVSCFRKLLQQQNCLFLTCF